MSILEVKNLSVGYNGLPVLQNLCFSVDKGSYVNIVGENGAGKSTLMKTLLGLLPPISGEIIMDSGKILGYLPQQTQVQKDFPASVYEVVLSGFVAKHKWYQPFYTKDEKEIAEKELHKVGMDRYARRSYRELSGGQQQRVLLARALCAAKDIIFLDEPVAGLDPEAQDDMYKIIKNLHEDGTTVMMISHDLESVNKYATHILYAGKNTHMEKNRKAVMVA